MSTSECSPTGSMFSLSVPSNKSGDWGTMDIAERTKHSRQIRTRPGKIKLHTVMQTNCRYINRINVDCTVNGLNDTKQSYK